MQPTSDKQLLRKGMDPPLKLTLQDCLRDAAHITGPRKWPLRLDMDPTSSQVIKIGGYHLHSHLDRAQLPMKTSSGPVSSQRWTTLSTSGKKKLREWRPYIRSYKSCTTQNLTNRPEKPSLRSILSTIIAAQQKGAEHRGLPTKTEEHQRAWTRQNEPIEYG